MTKINYLPLPSIYALILTGSLALLFSCKKEQLVLRSLEEDCSCAWEVSAEFSIEEIYAYGFNWEKRTETDSIYFNKNVSFKALEENAEYTWYIGSEKIHTKEVIRYFDQALIGQQVPITLVVKKKANNICFPLDDGYDSVTKILTVTKYIETTGSDYDFGSIEGTYRVKSDRLADSFDIKISVTRDDNLYPLERLLNLENYDGLGSNCFNHQGLEQNNYRQLYFENAGGCQQLYGDIHNKRGGIVEMNLHFNVATPEDYYSTKYLGRRL